MTNEKFYRRLETFASENAVHNKGALSVAITLSARWKNEPLPVNEDELLTAKGGQVRGLGGQNLKKILASHGISRTLSNEGGRTSRGSHELAQRYAAFINGVHAEGILRDNRSLEFAEGWWIERIKEYFNREGFYIQIDARMPISAIITDVLEQAQERQRQTSGSTLVGTVLEHLVGAKLALALGDDKVQHKPVSTADTSSGAAGDFEVEESVIHVTTSPSEPLIRKCEANAASGRRPIIICPTDFRIGTLKLAKALGVENRIEIFEAQEFISMNINEKAGFSSARLHETTMRLIDKYNAIIDETENDPSLRIEQKNR